MTGTTVALEVVYALPDRQTMLSLRVPHGATVGEALAASGIFELHPETAGGEVPVGIFGRVVGRDHRVEQGDRIEIYRPLTADPKASRNARVAKKRSGRENVRNMRA
jgi:putative ubiquitin-RnfH superfamily antitoxin RatB of RatAB toxin-antitoxin module